jgi:hypothetical protein
MVNIKLLWDTFERFIDSIYALELFEEIESDELPIFNA